MLRQPQSASRWRRVVICRLLALSITGSLLFVLFFPKFVSSHATEPLKALSFKDRIAVPAQGDHQKLVPSSHIHHVPGTSLDLGEPPSHRLTTEAPLQTDGDLTDRIAQLEQLLPDEFTTRGLLDPLVATGEALLRDLAYRVRVYREAFTAWKTLHYRLEDESYESQHVRHQLRLLDRAAAGRAKTVHVYDEFRSYINALGMRLFPWTTRYAGDHLALLSSIHNGGRGIALTAGNDQAPYLLTSIPSFRKLGCELPIEVLYLGEDDLHEASRDLLEAIPGVTTRDLTQMIEDEGWKLKGWAAKPFAMLMSSFREVIFIDADALFFVDPAVLFDDPQYQATGALFFKDRKIMPESREKWLREILPRPLSQHIFENRFWTGESAHMQESGVLVVDKAKHLVSLLLSTRLNGPDRDGDEGKGKRGVYDMVYGDKETFWLSWELAGDVDYAFHDSVAGSMGVLSLEHDDSVESESNKKLICSAQLLHFDSVGRPLWFNGWIEKHKFDSDHLLAKPEFEVFAKEPSETGGPPIDDPWSVHESNIMCLPAKGFEAFSNEEKDTLDVIQKIAEEVVRN